MNRFRTVADIRTARGGAARLDVLADGLSGLPRAGRIFLVTDGGVRGLGLADAAVASLEAAGYAVDIFDTVVADPPEHVVLEGTARARAAGAEAVVGFGGGSVMDVAKLVALLATRERDDLTLSGGALDAAYGVDRARGPRLPLVLVPTTSGTGSEVTNIAIVTTGKTSKRGVVADALYADRVLLDAELTRGLPPSATAATGLDAMVHAIEAFTSQHLKNPISDALALAALARMRPALPRAVADGNDMEAREAMLVGAMLAGQAFSNAPVGAVHALAYPLGGRFHVPHGLSNSLVLTEVLAFNAQEGRASRWYAEIAESLGLKASAGALIDEIERLKDAVRVPRRLRELDIPASAVAELADDALGQERLLRNNPRALRRADMLEIYERIA